MKMKTSTNATLAQLFSIHNQLHGDQEIEQFFFAESDATQIALDAIHNAMAPMISEIDKVNLKKTEQQSYNKVVKDITAPHDNFDKVVKEISAPREAHKEVMQELSAKSSNNDVLQKISKVGSPSLFGLKHVEPVVAEEKAVTAPSPKMV